MVPGSESWAGGCLRRPIGNDVLSVEYLSQNTSLACNASKHGLVNGGVAGCTRIADRHAIEAAIDRLPQSRVNADIRRHTGKEQPGNTGRAKYQLQIRCVERTEPRFIDDRLSRQWREDLDLRIATLVGLRDRLTTCIGCGCLSIDRCELLNPDDEAAALGAGAHYLTRERT